MRVLFFGTHPHCFNGYCVVTYNLAKELSTFKDVDLTIYGFQNFYRNQEHVKNRTLPSHVYIYDSFAGENPKQMGFGFDQVKSFVTMNKPDVCVIYNDMVVVSNILNQLKDIKNEMGFKIIVYIDQVYLYQKQEYIDRLNQEADYVMCFTEYWESILKGCGITKPMGFLQHGFDKMVNYPVPKDIARKHFGLQANDFIILNLNRNQPRKRWDICLQAFAEVISRHIGEPIKLLIATATSGAWNLMEIYERELKKRGLTMEDGKKHIILIDNPQQLADEDVNILYNVADIGLNTCDGEGFGLCNFQQAAIGIPQVVPNIGGFRDFFTPERAALVDPKFTLYIESTRDGVGGESELCDWRDVADAIDNLYSNPEDCKRIGQNARQHILEHYKWEDIGKKFHRILKQVVDGDEEKDDNVTKEEESETDPVIDIKSLENEFKQIVETRDFVDAPPEKIENKETNVKSEGVSKEELLELRKKLDRVLQALGE